MLCMSKQLQGPETDQLAAASKLEDDLNFYQTTNPNVAKLFNVEDTVKRPALVLLKKEEEKVVHYGKLFLLFSFFNSELYIFFWITLFGRRELPLD